MFGLRLVAALILPSMIWGQSPNAAPSVRFDAISIKQNQTSIERGGVEIPPQSDRIVVSNTPMYRIIAFAYDRQRNDLIEGLPEWARSERWDIQAKVADEDIPAFTQLSFVQKKRMLQAVLADRCQMRAHLAKKEVPVYALEVLKENLSMEFKEGLRMHPATASEAASASQGWDITIKRGEIHGRAVPIAALLYALSGVSLDRQVIDRTKLDGLYDFDLLWTPEDIADAHTGGTDKGLGEPPAPSIFTAIQEQLGLRLLPTKAQVEAVVVDHIERPSSN